MIAISCWPAVSFSTLYCLLFSALKLCSFTFSFWRVRFSPSTTEWIEWSFLLLSCALFYKLSVCIFTRCKELSFYSKNSLNWTSSSSLVFAFFNSSMVKTRSFSYWTFLFSSSIYSKRMLLILYYNSLSFLMNYYSNCILKSCISRIYFWLCFSIL